MTTRILTSVLFFWLSVAAFGQSIPYAELKVLDDCAKELRQIEGVTVELKLEHTKPEDTRDFQITLETPENQKTIKVNKDGTFRLPEVSRDNQGQTLVTHSLEKGALTVALSFDWSGISPQETNSHVKNLFEVCSVVANQFRKVEHVFVKLGDSIPAFEDFQIAIVGVSLSRERPCSGLAILKNGEKAVASIDLSQTGKASWMFSDYDPRTHRIVYEMKNGDPEPRLAMEITVGKGAVGGKGAILVRKLK